MKLLTYTGNLQIVDMCSCGKVWNNASVHVREATFGDVEQWAADRELVMISKQHYEDLIRR